jgi:LPXTG-motif cell wall-anchored protein
MTGTADPATTQAEIEATRLRLGRTVDEIGARLDVRAHAREKAFVARDIVVETYRESPPAVVGGVVALVGLVAGLVVWRRKRATRRRNR